MKKVMNRYNVANLVKKISRLPFATVFINFLMFRLTDRQVKFPFMALLISGNDDYLIPFLSDGVSNYDYISMMEFRCGKLEI